LITVTQLRKGIVQKQHKLQVFIMEKVYR